MKKKILVVCPTDWERTEIARSEQTAKYEFVVCAQELADSIGLWNALRFDVHRYLQQLADQHRGKGFAGVLGTGDYPGCMFSAFLSEQLGLPAPTPQSTVVLSHKFHSRELQQSIVPSATPHFAVIDPHRPERPPQLAFPFFVKPVKGTMSIRAQMVGSAQELRQAVHLSVRDQLRGWTLLSPYSQLLRMYRAQHVPIHCFVAESALRGVQVTVDGFVQNGVSTVMGITDSIMYPGTSSFERFVYPSRLPDSVQARMVSITNQLMNGSGFDHSCYNVELFYDQQADTISIIEINPRMSYQFSDLFAQVDGQSSFSVQLELATGHNVHWRNGNGPARVAASFVMRLFRDARVRSVPTDEQISQFQQRFPSAQAKILCAPGDRLSDHDQDVGSYRYCIINMAAQSLAELESHYEEAKSLLPFSFAG